MTKPIRLRAAAESDVAASAEFLQKTSLAAALRFLDAVDKTLALIAQNPSSGAKCCLKNPAYSDMRFRAVRGFRKHLIFYREHADEIEVVRILHGARDLNRIFHED